MALKFDNKVFYHIPKTGGNYTRRVIGKTVKAFEVGHSHSGPLDNPELFGLESFTNVRHPLEWYRSYYRHRESGQWPRNHDAGHHCRGDTFEEYIERMIWAYPQGYVTCRYMTTIPHVTHIIKTHNLTFNLKNLFISWGYEFPDYLSPVGATPRNIDTSLSKSVEDKILDIEHEIISYLNEI